VKRFENIYSYTKPLHSINLDIVSATDLRMLMSGEEFYDALRCVVAEKSRVVLCSWRVPAQIRN
jgi:hypothetical protein